MKTLQNILTGICLICAIVIIVMGGLVHITLSNPEIKVVYVTNTVEKAMPQEMPWIPAVYYTNGIETRISKQHWEWIKHQAELDSRMGFDGYPGDK
jgi:hypothetical protein